MKSLTLRARRTSLAATLIVALVGDIGTGEPGRASTPFLRRTPTVVAVENVGPSVVNITTETIVDRPNPFRSFGALPMDRFFRDFYGPSRTETVQSLGSGVIFDQLCPSNQDQVSIGRRHGCPSAAFERAACDVDSVICIF